MTFEDRLRKVEQQLARLSVPSLEAVGAAFARAAERARAKFDGEEHEPFADKRDEDANIVSRWAEASGVDLNVLAERARQKLEALGGRM